MEMVTVEHGGWNGDQTLLFNASALMVFAQLGLGQRERSEGQTGGRARHTIPQCHLPPLSSTDVLGTRWQPYLQLGFCAFAAVKRQSTNDFEQSFLQLAKIRDNQIATPSPETRKQVLQEVKKTNRDLFEEDPSQLQQDKLVELATPVKKRGLDGDLKAPLSLCG